MIRINLLPAKDSRRKRQPGAAAGGGNILPIFMLALLLELGGLYYWYMQADAAAATAGGNDQGLKAEKEKLEKTRKEIDELATLEEETAKQRVVFQRLENGKAGPVNMLLFASFALRKIDATLPEEEYRDLGDVWSTERRSAAAAGTEEWDPARVWVTHLTDKEGEITVEGQAKEHEDVMTFLKRLRSAVYFEGLDLVYQKANDKNELHVPVVDFQLKGELNWDPEGYPPVVLAKKGK